MGDESTATQEQGKENQDPQDPTPKDPSELLSEEFKELGVGYDEMSQRINPGEQDEFGGGGVARGPVMNESGDIPPEALPEKKDEEDDDTCEGDDCKDGKKKPEQKAEGDGESQEAVSEDDLVPIDEEALDEAVKMVKKRRGREARVAAKKAKKRYKRMKAKVKRTAKKWRKSAAGKRWMKKYKKAKKKIGAKRLGQMAGRKRLTISDLGLKDKLREEMSESKDGETPDYQGDIDILETGAIIAAILGDFFEDLELEEDAKAARQTSDNVVALLDQFESENKAIPDDEMAAAVKALALVVDHYEKLDEADLPLPR